jgi:hypothetical protein
MKSYPARNKNYCGEFAGSAIILPLLAAASSTRLLIRWIPRNDDLGYRVHSNGFEEEILQNDSDKSAECYNPQNGT